MLTSANLTLVTKRGLRGRLQGRESLEPPSAPDSTGLSAPGPHQGHSKTQAEAKDSGLWQNPAQQAVPTQAPFS